MDLAFQDLTDLSWAKTERQLRAIQVERAQQDARWGSQRHLPDDTWNRILGEEVGEVAKALNEKEGNAALRAELIQVAAVAVAWAEAIYDRVGD